MSEVDDSGAHTRPLTSNTRVALKPGQIASAVCVLAAIVASSVAQYYALSNGIRGVKEDLARHVSDADVHLDHMRTVSRGYPVGSAEYALDQLRVQGDISALKDRPILVGRDCRQTLSGFVCDQKRP